jgi:uncharacterized protein (TIGR02266 family)
MGYSGAEAVKESRQLLGTALERLQAEKALPPDVLAVVQNLAQAVGALFDAERSSSDLDGRASVRHAMAFLSQTMALLQDVRSKHPGIDTATKALAEVMRRLFPLASAPSMRPPPAVQPVQQPAPHASVAKPAPAAPAAAPAAASVPRETAGGKRASIEANVGATTESNFFVGFSGDIADGGVFVATYLTLDPGTKVDLLVTLPGGFEQKIPGTVRFVRDPMDMDSEPGLGVKFDRLEKDARELILRFIRKRPPLFYDE